MVRFETVVYAREAQLTAYSGKSLERATETSDMLRAALILGRGTGLIVIRHLGVIAEKWEVLDGNASLKYRYECTHTAHETAATS